MSFVVHDLEHFALVYAPPVTTPYRIEPHEGILLRLLPHERRRLWQGSYRVYGTVRREGAIAPGKKVLLFTEHMEVPIAETYSGPDGSYEFRGLPPGRYVVIALDTGGEPEFYPDITRVEAEPE